MTHRFRHSADMCAAARRMLLARQDDDDIERLVDAAFTRGTALRDIREGDLDSSARAWVRTIREAFPAGQSVTDRARLLTPEHKRRFADAVDQLALWLERRAGADD